MARKKNGTKRGFVLTMPLDLPAKDIVQKAKDAGMKLTEAYVYSVRSLARKTSESGAPSAKGPSEVEFRRLTLELGLGKAKELLRQTEQKIADVIRGQ